MKRLAQTPPAYTGCAAAADVDGAGAGRGIDVRVQETLTVSMACPFAIRSAPLMPGTLTTTPFPAGRRTALDAEERVCTRGSRSNQRTWLDPA